jgi:hypothetical protein
MQPSVDEGLGVLRTSCLCLLALLVVVLLRGRRRGQKSGAEHLFITGQARLLQLSKAQEKVSKASRSALVLGLCLSLGQW